jgi:hypothetical protein
METRSGPHRLRASDSEREEVATILKAAMTEGRLPLAEGEERLAAAYAAAYRDELGPLTADLPYGGRRALFDTPEAKASARDGMRRHAVFAALLAAVLVTIWALAGGGFFWPVFPLVFLALSVRRHAWWLRVGHGGPPWRGAHGCR